MVWGIHGVATGVDQELTPHSVWGIYWQGAALFLRHPPHFYSAVYTGKRFKCNRISALSNRGQLQFMIFKRNFNNSVCLKFLRRLLKHNRQKVVLIWDGHPVHRSAAVAKFVAAHAARLNVYRLPTYSPDLNPDELVNNDVKSSALGRKRPRNQKQMIRNIRTHMQQRKDDPPLVRRFFQEESVRYAAA